MTRAAVLLVVLAAAAEPAASPVFTYRFDAVKSKVLRAPGGDEKKEAKVAAGDAAQPGDTVRTGFWGSATLSVPERAAKFEIDSSTKVRLASGEPGVLLVIEKGKLKAFFEKLGEGVTEERRVAAPGALLAVRGTRYGVEVGSDGDAVLAVFEGTVEVIPTAPGLAPVPVHANEFSTFGPRTPPHPPMPMRERGMSEGSWGRRQAEGGPGGPNDPGRGGPMQPGSQQPGGPQRGPGQSGPAPMPGGGMGGGRP